MHQFGAWIGEGWAASVGIEFATSSGMKITFWGVRGSIATAGPQFARYGGNTTCIEVETKNQRIIIDAGTGLRGLGDKLLRESAETGNPVKASLLFTHLHWDHIQGFPFFRPAFVPSTELDLYGPSTEDGRYTMKQVLERQMQPPNFPVPLGAMGSRKTFHGIGSDQVIEIGDVRIETRALQHPQGSLAYRIEADGRSMVFATDTELTGPDELDEGLISLARNTDLLIHDAQYTEAQYNGEDGPCRKGWGHSTYVSAAAAARAAGAKGLALFHHDPEHDDDKVDAMARDAGAYYAGAFAAREGATVRL